MTCFQQYVPLVACTVDTAFQGHLTAGTELCILKLSEPLIKERKRA